MKHRSGPAAAALASIIAAMSIAGCESTTAPRIAVLFGVSGSGQSAPAGTTLPLPFVVRVEDQNGAVVEGFTVTWQVTAGGGTLTENESATDAQGLATTTLILGAFPAINRVRASIGSSSTVTFTATGTTVTPSP